MNFSDGEIKKIKDEILKRSEYKDDAKNKEYIENMRDAYYAYSLYGHHGAVESVFEEEKKKLETKKLNEIKKEINDDSGFHDLLKKLPDLKANLEELTNTQLDNPTISQRMYTTISRKPNNADQNKAARENKIQKLTNIINEIETLQPIYTETTKTGGKRKTRYYKKGKKSKKRKTKKRKTRKTGKI